MIKFPAIIFAAFVTAGYTEAPLDSLSASEQILQLVCLDQEGATPQRCACELDELKARTGSNYAMFVEISAASLSDQPGLSEAIMTKYGINAADPTSLLQLVTITNKLAEKSGEIRQACQSADASPARQ